MSEAIAEEEPRTFPAYAERPFSWVLLGFIGLSLLVHAFAFLVFQVVYPQRVTIPPPSVQVSLLNPDTPEQQAILRWVDAEDPALVATGAVAIPPSLFEVPYKPSYAALRTPPRNLPVPSERPEQPPSPLSLPLRLPGEATPKRTAPDSSATAPLTSAEFGGLLASRGFRPSGELHAQATAPLEPPTFLIAVNAAGQVRNVFRQQSSGDDAADQAASDYLAHGTFSARPGTAVTWGLATIIWGREIYPKEGVKNP
jgi:hypothetical protein